MLTASVKVGKASWSSATCSTVIPAAMHAATVWRTGLAARLIQSLGQFDAASVLDDQQWPMARPYRRLAAEPMGDVTTARRARGVREPGPGVTAGPGQ